MIDKYIDDQSKPNECYGDRSSSKDRIRPPNSPALQTLRSPSPVLIHAGWWAMFALRAHQAYPNATWLEMVETINNNNTLYWDTTCGGGVLWLTYRPLIKNTITNG